MSSQKRARPRPRSGSLRHYRDSIESDPNHHLAGPFLPQSPIGSNTPTSVRSMSPASPLAPLATGKEGLWYDIKTMRWAIIPTSALKLLLIPLVLYFNWEISVPFINPNIPNPFHPFIFLSHRVLSSSPDDPRFSKGLLDLVFIAYHIVFFSLMRQIFTVNVAHAIARYYRITKITKIERLGEQVYAFVYFGAMGAWGYRIMSQHPTFWYRNEYFWIDYPHWDMKGELKRYYLMQSAYWCQQLIVLLLGLEKPRKDYRELVMHHFVTLYLVGWSYIINLTLIGNAVYMSMDIPDALLAFSKALNYLRWDITKLFTFAFFAVVWTYMRHWLNLRILWSVYFESDLVPEEAKRLAPRDGVWMPWWMKYQILVPLTLLQLLNLFWYYFIVRILTRVVTSATADDDRSDDEDDGEDDGEEEDRDGVKANGDAVDGADDRRDEKEKKEQ